MNKELYPKTYKRLGEWVASQMRIPNQAEVLAAIPTETIAEMAISTRSKALYQFFDDNQVYAGIWPVNDVTTSKLVWKWKVVGKAPDVESSTGSREESEDKCFEESFKRLENRL